MPIPQDDNYLAAAHPESTELPSLSIVIPVFNEATWISKCLESVLVALSRSGWDGSEVIVVNDGSTDGTSEALRTSPIPVRVIDQPNLGRWLARLRGIEEASGELILLLDSRVLLHPQSLKYISQQLSLNPANRVWNGHVHVVTKGNPYARFWNSVASAAWYRYFRNPRRLSFGIEHFDLFPKGAGCFLAPKRALITAYENVRTSFEDLRHANDDTLLIRDIATRFNIHLSPEFACEYNSRSSAKKWPSHLFNRGVVVVDGYLRPESKYRFALIAFFFLSPTFLVIMLWKPWLCLMIVFSGILALAGVGKFRGLSLSDAIQMALLAPVFGVFYAAGVWKGLLLRMRATLANRTL